MVLIATAHCTINHVSNSSHIRRNHASIGVHATSGMYINTQEVHASILWNHAYIHTCTHTCPCVRTSFTSDPTSLIRPSGWQGHAAGSDALQATFSLLFVSLVPQPKSHIGNTYEGYLPPHPLYSSQLQHEDTAPILQAIVTQMLGAHSINNTSAPASDGCPHYICPFVQRSGAMWS